MLLLLSHIHFTIYQFNHQILFYFTSFSILLCTTVQLWSVSKVNNIIIAMDLNYSFSGMTLTEIF